MNLKMNMVMMQQIILTRMNILREWFPMMTTTVMSTMTTCNPCDYETAKCEYLLFRKGLIVLFMNEYLWKEFFQFFSDD